MSWVKVEEESDGNLAVSCHFVRVSNDSVQIAAIITIKCSARRNYRIVHISRPPEPPDELCSLLSLNTLLMGLAS